jgi:hypothetical protein
MIKELCVKCWDTLDSHALNGCPNENETIAGNDANN